MNKVIAALDRLPGPWLIFIAAVLWSTAGGVSKSVEMDKLLFCALRALIGGLVLLPIFRPKDLVWDKWLIVLVVSYASTTGLVISAMAYATAGTAIALQDSAPLWLFLWALFVQKQRMGWRRILPVALVCISIIVFLMESNGSFIGFVMGVVAGIGFAGLTLSMGKVRAASPFSLVAVMNLFGGVLMLIGALLIPGKSLAVPIMAWPVLLLMGVIQLSGSYVCYNLGVRKTDPQRASILVIWELVLTPVWAFLLVRELPSFFGFIGWLIMLAAITLESTIDRPKHIISEIIKEGAS